ncbi:MAG: hypothetical protein KBA66_06830 [Leptospiraceae bacterium]|nr:hypothetical protein [Leptospiraceae bacterium]
MKQNIFLITVLFLSFCQKPKETELNDPEWRKESLEISYKICSKLGSCVVDDFTKLKKGLQNYSKAEIKPEKCNEKHKKSRVFLLKGSDPLKIKETARACFTEFEKLSCEEIRSGGINKIIPCENMKKIQQGITF